MRKKSLFILIILVGVFLLFIALNVTGRPGYGDDHDSCHNSAGYTIGTNVTGEIDAITSSNVIFSISATGADIFIQAISGADDNDLFIIQPTTGRINETSVYDLDSSPNSINVVFNITTPEQDGYYTIFIIAGNDASGQINFAYQKIIINVGGVSAPTPNPLDVIYDHLGLYLGMPALLLLSIGTVLVLLNENKFVKIHGIFAGTSWILTLVNVTAALIKIDLQAWLSGYDLIYHLPHILLGALGLVTGAFSMLFGIAAERRPARMTGYLTLICWWAAFVTGYLLKPNLFVF